ncbi:transmembrane emp24 domain-containing protein 5 isoform X1 [Agrilus planipennis]|uniref:Transmembrane emp24 domain-containing protein 5 isoform X1 n=1 Tax=Agrilus planipennis TaxID=224129 RepID=A0A1W4X7C5_AGRPL|nr:transmembrane emp24 domain-containing protein 5 isoform X1 [Agrilus planipennis]
MTLRVSLISLFAYMVLALEKEMTINVEAGREDCFYQEVKEGEVIDFDYQVIDGGHGDLDVTLRIADPTGRILIADFKKSENSHRLEASLTGDYKFCFDNTYSSYNTKTVFFGLLLDEDDSDSHEIVDVRRFDNLISEKQFDFKIDDVMGPLAIVKDHLIKARRLQEIMKSFEARDRNIAEENNYKINFFSLVQILVMLSVGMVQMIMLKSLFNVDSKVQKLWKKIDPN